MSWEEKAKILYANHDKLPKAVAAGKAIDNALKLEYTKGGTTKTSFLMPQYLAYFDYEVLKSYGLTHLIADSI